MIYITFVVPSYNAEKYLDRNIPSLAVGGEDVEVLVIDDGSKDDTLKIAKSLEEQYPGIVKAIHQENKGHGGAVQTGIANATGLYYKVIDSDDWANTEDVLKLVNQIKENLNNDKKVLFVGCPCQVAGRDPMPVLSLLHRLSRFPLTLH